MVGMLQRIEAHDAAAAGGVINGHTAALKTLWALTLREAQTQTFADIFLVIALCFVAATLLVPAMRKVQSQVAAVSAESH
jgi:DHA2 family multidrug resistance protein